jgi:serine/threonine protein kinase
MDQAILTPLAKRNPKTMRRLAMTIEKAMGVRPEDRYQSADDFQEDLLESRSTTRKKTPLDLTVEPPPTFEGEKVKEGGADSPSQSGDSNDTPSFPISSILDRKGGRNKKVAPREKNFTWLFSILLLSLVLFVTSSYIEYPF